MGKKENILKNKYYDCKYAYLMRSDIYAPIVAMREKTKGREVANTILHCPYFDRNGHSVEVHPMILCG